MKAEKCSAKATFALNSKYMLFHFKALPTLIHSSRGTPLNHRASILICPTKNEWVCWVNKSAVWTGLHTICKSSNNQTRQSVTILQVLVIPRSPFSRVCLKTRLSAAQGSQMYPSVIIHRVCCGLHEVARVVNSLRLFLLLQLAEDRARCQPWNNTSTWASGKHRPWIPLLTLRLECPTSLQKWIGLD